MLSIGDVLILETAAEEGDKEVFRSKVLDITDRSFFIGPPLKEASNRTEPIILEGTSFQVQFVAKNQKVYQFNTTVLKKSLKNIPTFEMERPKKEDFVPIQRRSFIRIETQLKVKVFSLHNEFAPFDTYTTNISAGGLNLVLPKQVTLENEQIVRCSFILPLQDDDIYLQLTCKVVRLTDKMPHRYASVKFEQISEKERQSIVRYCFERQLALRKKGF